VLGLDPHLHFTKLDHETITESGKWMTLYFYHALLPETRGCKSNSKLCSMIMSVMIESFDILEAAVFQWEGSMSMKMSHVFTCYAELKMVLRG
jgi:hypothetical protein